MFSFPSFKAWRKAIVLFIATYLPALIVPIFIFWQFFIVFMILFFSKEEVSYFFLAITVGILIAIIIGYFLLLILYSLLLKIFWSKPPQWLKPPQSLKKKSINLGIAILATLPVTLLYVIYIIVVESVESLTKTDIKSICPPNIMLKLSWIWLIGAAYLYQWKYAIQPKKYQN